MRLSTVLRLPPKFHYWKDFGAGRRRRMPYYKYWYDQYRGRINKEEPIDYTLSLDQLPSGSRLMDAEDFMRGHIDLMPEELIKLRDEKVIYNHPWPFNVQLDPIKNQEPMHQYSINTRFFVPREDSLVLANTILETDCMEAHPPFELKQEHIDRAQRQIDWSKEGDSILVSKPKKREWPRIDQVPRRLFGINKHRSEMNIMSSLSDLTQMLLAQHYHKNGDKTKMDELLLRRSVGFPRCKIPVKRSDRLINLDLCIDYLALSSDSLPVIEYNPESTKDKSPVDIHPRSWKSLLEQSRIYTPEWSFSLPTTSHLHTIQLCSRIIRDYRDKDEMLARAIVHSFGLTYQFARFKEYKKLLHTNQKTQTNRQESVILQNPLDHIELDGRERLEEPIVLQTIAFDQPNNVFHFLRYQLNTTLFDDDNHMRVKNQAWYSGPVGDLEQVLNYYLDFQSFNPSAANRVLNSSPLKTSPETDRDEPSDLNVLVRNA